MNINFLDKQRKAFENKNNLITIKQDEIVKLQNEIATKEEKLKEMNMDYFRVVTNPDKLKVHTKLKEDLVNLKVKLQAAKEELSLFQSTYKFEYDPEQIASELAEQAEKAELQKRIENIEAVLQEARREAEELVKELFEYNRLITNTVNVYKANVSESNADLNKIEEAKQVIYNLHNSPVAYLVKDYPAGYYTKHESIFK